MTPSELCDAAEKVAPGQALDLLLAAVKVCAGRKQAARFVRKHVGIAPVDVVLATSQVTGISVSEIRGRSKCARSARARQVAWTVIYDRVAESTLSEIGAEFGRNGETVSSGISRARALHQGAIASVEQALGLHAEAAE